MSETYQDLENPLLTKREIIERLFTKGHISFIEMWTLMDNTGSKYVVLGEPSPPSPYTPGTSPHWHNNTTCINKEKK
jgi:hypothetical protein